MVENRFLVADVGGTNARFALADSVRPGFTHKRTYQCADFATSYAAIDAYLGDVSAGPLAAICVAAAGPVANGAVTFTNNHWSLDAATLRETYAVPVVDLLNDFEAVALSLPCLQPDDVIRIGSRPAPNLQDRDFTVAAVGAGTGLGSAGLKRHGELTLPIVAEAGHTGFAARTPLQSALQSQLQTTISDLCNEDLVSGPGIERVYSTLTEIRGVADSRPSSADIFAAAMRQDDALAAEAVALFFEILGQFAGDLALTMGAWDGVFIAGGMATRYPEALQSSRFRSGFESKGEYRSLMQSIPTVLISMPDPGLLGASACALASCRGRSAMGSAG